MKQPRNQSPSSKTSLRYIVLAILAFLIIFASGSTFAGYDKPSTISEILPLQPDLTNKDKTKVCKALKTKLAILIRHKSELLKELESASALSKPAIFSDLYIVETRLKTTRLEITKTCGA